MKMVCKENTYTRTEGLIFKKEKTYHFELKKGHLYDVSVYTKVDTSQPFSNNMLIEHFYCLLVCDTKSKTLSEIELPVGVDIIEVLNQLFNLQEG